MILRLIIALIRWLWGVSPAWITPELNNFGWWVVMALGALIDIMAFTSLVIAIIDFFDKGKRGKNETANG